MSKFNNNIIITDWINNILFEGHKDDKEVERIIEINDIEDIYVEWQDTSCQLNVWDYIL